MSTRQWLYRQRERERNALSVYRARATDAMTLKQLNDFYAGKLKTKSKKITRWMELIETTQKELQDIQERIDRYNSLELIETEFPLRSEPRGELRAV